MGAFSPLQDRDDDGGELALHAFERVNRTTFLAVAWSATFLSFTHVVFRVVVRLRSSRKLHVDDCLIIAAWLMLLVSSILWQVRGYVVYWQYDVVYGRTYFTLEFAQAYTSFQPVILALNLIFPCCLWAVKFSFLVFFRRLGSSLVVRKYWWVVTVITTLGLIACIGDIDYKCATANMEYLVSELSSFFFSDTTSSADMTLARCPRANHVNFHNRTFIANTVIDLSTNLLITSIPILIIWNVKMPRRRKMILLGIFSASIFISVAAVVRVALVSGADSKLRYASIDWLYLWSMVEMAVGMCLSPPLQNQEMTDG